VQADSPPRLGHVAPAREFRLDPGDLLPDRHGDELLKVTCAVAPRVDADVLARGEEPRHPIVLEELYFRDGAMVFWSDRQGGHYVEPTADLARWHERESEVTTQLVELIKGS